VTDGREDTWVGLLGAGINVVNDVTAEMAVSQLQCLLLCAVYNLNLSSTCCTTLEQSGLIFRIIKIVLRNLLQTF